MIFHEHDLNLIYKKISSRSDAFKVLCFVVSKQTLKMFQCQDSFLSKFSSFLEIFSLCFRFAIKTQTIESRETNTVDQTMESKCSSCRCKNCSCKNCNCKKRPKTRKKVKVSNEVGSKSFWKCKKALKAQIWWKLLKALFHSWSFNSSKLWLKKALTQKSFRKLFT